MSWHCKYCGADGVEEYDWYCDECKETLHKRNDKQITFDDIPNTRRAIQLRSIIKDASDSKVKEW